MTKLRHDAARVLRLVASRLNGSADRLDPPTVINIQPITVTVPVQGSGTGTANVIWMDFGDYGPEDAA